MEKNIRLLFAVNGLVWLFGTACTRLVNTSSLINMVLLFGTNNVVFLLLFEKPTPPTLSFMVMLPITPYSTAFHKAYATLNVMKKAFNSSMS